MSTKTIGLSVFAVVLLAFTGSVFAQTVSAQTTMAPHTPACPSGITIVPGLYRGQSGAKVTALQHYLAALGYFNMTATGYFGPITYGAVVAFQRDNGLPTTGYFGPMTHGAVTKKCATAGDGSVISQINGIDPTSGTVGTKVTITGNNFTNDNTIHFGAGVIMHVPISSTTEIQCITAPCYPIQTLTFTVPESLDPACFFENPRCLMASRETSPGNYEVSVENASGTSNSILFTVTGASVSDTPRIDSVSPQSADEGADVTIKGRGFTEDAVIHYYKNGEPYGSTVAGTAVRSSSKITFEVPEWIGAYCHPNSACIAIAKSLEPGTYMIAVETVSGMSNQVVFTKTP